MILTLCRKGFYIRGSDEGGFCLRWLVLPLYLILAFTIYAAVELPFRFLGYAI